MTDCETIFIVDDDESVRHSLQWFLEALPNKILTFASAEIFLDKVEAGSCGCLILDVRMPGIDGLELQRRLNQLQSTLPIIMLTGHGDVPMAVNAMSEGAFDFIQKPFDGPYLLDKLQQALAISRLNCQQRQQKESLLKQLSNLTRREREVMALVTEGLQNKVIAHQLGIVLRTVEVHRHNLMEKLTVRSVCELVKIKLLAQQWGVWSTTNCKRENTLTFGSPQ